ncbi:efflux RND transporter periplasmic adaptor subunit [Lacihabitans lacunae]|uniref:Efflux RND transporter periplasmic adaptor subunit n=1 Tax=Lacihabitans lacunae TaxID=1028214 RepID=A0ABV7YT80_9BACT
MNNLKYIIAFVLLGTVFSCQTEKKAEEENPSEKTSGFTFTKTQLANLPVEYGDLEQVSIDHQIVANGIVDVPPDHVFMISYPVSGYISSISHNLLPGRLVKKGEVLAVIQSMELLQLEENYLNETTQREFQVLEYNRQKALLADDATAKRKLQEVESNLKLNQIKIRSFEEKLKILGINPSSLTPSKISASHQIYARNSGFIKSVNVASGKNFRPEDILFEIINTEHVHVELKVFGDDMNSVKEGQNVVFKDKETNKDVIGKVYLIDKMVDVAQKSLNIHVHIEDERYESSLKPGQFLSGAILIKSKPVTAIKESAILINSEGKYGIYKVDTKDGAVFHQVELKTGGTANGYVEILNPEVLKGKIVTKGVNFVVNSGEEE